MQVTELAIAGAWLFTPEIHGDDRGSFREAFTATSFLKNVGHTFDLRQMNVSVSSAGTIRGIHYADVPPSQAKYVQCLHGAIVDVVVDIRVGSPTFGRSEAVELDARSGKALYIAEGLGHAFCALTDGATVGYLCSEPYAPQREHGIHPLDEELALPWPTDLPQLLSSKDEQAPTFAEAQATGLLPTWASCQELYKSLSDS